MEYIKVGKIITTHGLKGEMKLRSNFLYKDKVFKVGFKVFVGKNYEEHEILSYRKHKDYDMVILSDILDIDKAIGYKQNDVYVLKSHIILEKNNYLNEDLIGLKCFYNNNYIGEIIDIVEQSFKYLFYLDNKKYIPKDNNFIEKIDLEKKEIHFKNMEGLL